MKISKLLLTFLLINLFHFSFSQDKFYTCINEKGERIFSLKARSVGTFKNGMAEVQKTILIDGKGCLRTGFINEKGIQVIPCVYEQVYGFYDNVTWVRESGSKEYFLIDKTGKKVSDKTWSKVSYFFNGFCGVYNEEDKMGFVNRKGELVIPCKYLGNGFCEGLACVAEYDNPTGIYGFIDTTGAFAIPLQYKQAGTSDFENGECRVQINGVTHLINKKGEVIFKPTLTKNCMGFSNNLSASYTNSTNRSGWGYYNRQNEWVIKPEYDNANSFVDGLAVVEKGGKYGVIDTTGKIIIPIIYASIYANPSEDGYFGVELEENGTKQHLRADGTPFTSLPIKYLYSCKGYSILPYCDQDNKYGYLNLDGTVFIAAQFESAGSLNEGKAWIKGNTDALIIASGIDASLFAKEFTIGENLKAQKNGNGAFLPATLKQISGDYYMVEFTAGGQEWLVFDNLAR